MGQVKSRTLIIGALMRPGRNDEGVVEREAHSPMTKNSRRPKTCTTYGLHRESMRQKSGLGWWIQVSYKPLSRFFAVNWRNGPAKRKAGFWFEFAGCSVNWRESCTGPQPLVQKCI